MGKTLLGIDLDESPVGGLIEGLLSEEDLEKLADGGRAPDDEAGTSDGGDADEAGRDGTATEEAGVGTDLVDDAVGSDDDTDATRASGTDVTEPSGGVDTPSPGAAPSGLTGRVPSPGEESSDDGGGGWKAKLRPVLLKATVALAVLAVVGFIAYRYLGAARDAVSDKLGSDEDTESPPTTGATDGVPEARRRAKAPSRGREEFADRSVDDAVHRAEDADRGGASDESDTAGRPKADSDVGALVGLAALAIVAAAVRKFGEDRPRDPLVDGPVDDDE